MRRLTAAWPALLAGATVAACACATTVVAAIDASRTTAASTRLGSGSEYGVNGDDIAHQLFHCTNPYRRDHPACMSIMPHHEEVRLHATASARCLYCHAHARGPRMASLISIVLFDLREHDENPKAKSKRPSGGFLHTHPARHCAWLSWCSVIHARVARHQRLEEDAVRRSAQHPYLPPCCSLLAAIRFAHGSRKQFDRSRNVPRHPSCIHRPQPHALRACPIRAVGPWPPVYVHTQTSTSWVMLSALSICLLLTADSRQPSF